MTNANVEPLDPNELIFRARTHPKILFVPIVAQVILFALHFLIVKHFPEATNDFLKWTKWGLHGAIVILELVYFVAPVARWWLDTFEMTRTKAKSHTGLISRSNQEILASRISQVKVERGFLDLIFGSGTIKLYDASNTLGLEFKDVPKVKKVKILIDQTSANARRVSGS